MLPRCIMCCYVGVYAVTVIVLECSSRWQHLFLRLQLLCLILTVRVSRPRVMRLGMLSKREVALCVARRFLSFFFNLHNGHRLA